MSAISIFDILKIGIGPSSSHTLGPWKSALEFVKMLEGLDFDCIQIHLYGSLSKTGIGHATDKALILGLMGYLPTKIDIEQINSLVDTAKKEGVLIINKHEIAFIYNRDIVFEKTTHALHPNTLKFVAYSNNKRVKEQLFTSVGGGFIEYENTAKKEVVTPVLPYPSTKAIDILKHTKTNNCSIWQIVFQNELAFRNSSEIAIEIDLLIETIFESMYVGCTVDGILPGGLNVKRRAKKMCENLLEERIYSTREEWIALIQAAPKDFNSVNKWVSCFALAVNEHNASMGRVVTSPTNGAAGVIPAVLMYYFIFCDYKGKEDLKRFLYTAGEIGSLFVKGATISAAVGGCQAEIGVSSAMAAGALTEALGGSPEQCLMAAEIAMEHHLGLTCDPVKGLVQVPCIERNAMGAIKAITASNLALERDACDAIVSLDSVINTMWEVAQDMHSKYKETSEGGLAVNLTVAAPYC